MIKALLEIENDNHFSPDARFEACSLKENLLKFEIILTSQIYLRIFEISSPLSKYLQTSGIDFMKCNYFINHFKKKLMSFSRDFEKVKRSADKFVNEMNSIMETEGIDAAIETNLPVKRIKKRKKMADEMPSTSGADNVLLKPKDEYETYTVLENYSFLTSAYSIIRLAYKYIITQSVTQVACERSFSKLRYIKNRLRTIMGQKLLSSFMLMSIEKDILSNLDSQEVIDLVANRSKLFQKELLF